MTRRRALPALLLPALVLGLGACSDAQEGEIVVTAYPLQFVAERVAGDAAQVVSVAPAGTEPHDVELSPAAVGRLSSADVVLMLSDFQPAVDDALTEVGGDTLVVDAADSANLLTVADQHGEDHEEDDGHGHGDVDPHFWLDPDRLADVADAFADALAENDPGSAEEYRTNAATLRSDLDTLRDAYETGLAECASRTIVTSHEAFGYLAAAFGLEQIGIAGLDPEAEPSPAHVAEVLEQARDDGVTTIFNEPGAVVASTGAIADELGVTLATLDPIEIAPDGSDYLGQMEANLAALREGLECR